MFICTMNSVSNMEKKIDILVIYLKNITTIYHILHKLCFIKLKYSTSTYPPFVNRPNTITL